MLHCFESHLELGACGMCSRLLSAGIVEAERATRASALLYMRHMPCIHYRPGLNVWSGLKYTHVCRWYAPDCSSGKLTIEQYNIETALQH